MASFSMTTLSSALPSVDFSLASRAPIGVSPAAPQSKKAMLSSRLPSSSFTGMCRDDRLPMSSAASADSNFGRLAETVSNGALVFCMRHQKKLPKLNLAADQRKALLRALTTQVLQKGSITITTARAKALRKHVDHIIQLAKGGSLHERRQALSWVYDKQLVHAIFTEAPKRYADRNGGYCRVVRALPRRGDNAPMSVIELVE